MSDETTVIMLITLCMGLMKVLDKVVDWGMTKFSNGKNGSRGKNGQSMVHLDPETSRMIHEVHAKTSNMSEVLAVKDQDGAPMVYYPRSLSEDLRQIAECMRDISYTQKLLIDRMEARIQETHVIRR